MPSVNAKQSNLRPSHKADNAVRAIEYAMQELVSSGVSTSDVANSFSYLSNDNALSTAVQASLTARTS